MFKNYMICTVWWWWSKDLKDFIMIGFKSSTQSQSTAHIS